MAPPPPPIQPRSPSHPANWASTAIDVQYQDLPTLPSIRDPSTARRVVTHKRSLMPTPGSSTLNTAYDAEIKSYRREEWIGDTYLQALVSHELFRRFHKLSSAGLTTLRSRIVSNYTLSFLALAYNLPSTMATYSNATGPNKLDDNILYSQYVAADLLEAHLGALTSEEPSRTDEVRKWIQDLLSPKCMPTLDKDAELLLAERKQAETSARGNKRPRSSEPHFENDKPTGERFNANTTRCACGTRDVSVDVARRLASPVFGFADNRNRDDGWHSTLFLEGHPVTCGNNKKRETAREGALEEYFTRERSKRCRSLR